MGIHANCSVSPAPAHQPAGMALHAVSFRVAADTGAQIAARLGAVVLHGLWTVGPNFRWRMKAAPGHHGARAGFALSGALVAAHAK